MPGNIHGLDTTTDKGNSGDESDENGDKKRESFFVGGSTHSGQSVFGPPSGNRDYASRLMDSARNAGAEELSPEQAEISNASNTAGPITYQAGVYRLGGHGQPSQAMHSSTQRAVTVAPTIVNIYIWLNGYSIDEGPLLSYDEQSNQQFLRSVMSGVVPPEFTAKYPGQKLDVRVVRKPSDYVAPKPKPFSGPGRKLGSS